VGGLFFLDFSLVLSLLVLLELLTFVFICGLLFFFLANLSFLFVFLTFVAFHWFLCFGVFFFFCAAFFCIFWWRAVLHKKNHNSSGDQPTPPSVI